MIEAILNFVFVVVMILIIIIVTVVCLKGANRSQCDYDCEHCPFPKCSDEQIARWKERDLYNR